MLANGIVDPVNGSDGSIFPERKRLGLWPRIPILISQLQVTSRPLAQTLARLTLSQTHTQNPFLTFSLLSTFTLQESEERKTTNKMSHFGRSGPPEIKDSYSLLVLNLTFRMHFLSLNLIISIPFFS